MSATRPDPRGAECPSDLGLSELMAGDFRDPAREQALRAHVAACTRCGPRLARLQAGPLPPLAPLALPAAATSTPPSLPRATPATGRAARRWRRGPLAAAGLTVAAAAAAALLLRVAPSDDPLTTSPNVRVKGEIALGVIVRRASGQTERIASGAAVAPGDVLRFQLAHAAPGYAAVLGLDARQNVSLYVPQDAAGALPFLAGPDATLLPGAVRLDDAPGAERLFGVLCAEALPPERLRRQAADRLAAAAGQPEKVETLGLPCQEASFVITKAPRP